MGPRFMRTIIPISILLLIHLHMSCFASATCVSAPTILNTQTEVRFNDGDTPFILQCEAEAIPAPTYQWRLNWTDSDFINLGFNGRNITINDAIDEEVYYCLATNECGTAVQEFRVTVSYLDAFAKPRNDLLFSVQEGNAVELTCKPPDGVPDADIYWTIGRGAPIPVMTSSRVNTYNVTGNLIFANVFNNDTDDYICNARNSGTNVVFSEVLQLEVTGPLGGTHGPSILVSPPEQVEVLRGESFRLECMATGRPTPSITWTKTEGPARRNEVEDDSFGLALAFENVDFDDRGIYKCSASSNRGEDIRTTNVTVKSAPYWIEEPGDVNIAPGNGGTIACSTGGDPVPDVRWLSNGEELQANETIRVEGTNIVITMAEQNDSRVLQCVSTNIYGRIFTNVALSTFPVTTTSIYATTDLFTPSLPTLTYPPTIEGVDYMTTVATETSDSISSISSITDTADVETTTPSMDSPFTTMSKTTSSMDTSATMPKTTSSIDTITPGKEPMTTKPPTTSPLTSIQGKTSIQTTQKPILGTKTTRKPSLGTRPSITVTDKSESNEQQTGTDAIAIIIPILVVVFTVVVCLICVVVYKRKKSGTFHPSAVSDEGVEAPTKNEDLDTIEMGAAGSSDPLLIIEEEKNPLTGISTKDSEKEPDVNHKTIDNGGVPSITDDGKKPSTNDNGEETSTKDTVEENTNENGEAPSTKDDEEKPSTDEGEEPSTTDNGGEPSTDGDNGVEPPRANDESVQEQGNDEQPEENETVSELDEASKPEQSVDDPPDDPVQDVKDSDDKDSKQLVEEKE